MPRPAKQPGRTSTSGLRRLLSNRIICMQPNISIPVSSYSARSTHGESRSALGLPSSIHNNHPPHLDGLLALRPRRRGHRGHAALRINLPLLLLLLPARVLLSELHADDAQREERDERVACREDADGLELLVRRGRDGARRGRRENGE